MLFLLFLQLFLITADMSCLMWLTDPPKCTLMKRECLYQPLDEALGLLNNLFIFKPPRFCPLLSFSPWAQLRRERQGCLQGLNSYSELLRASEKNLCECQENLQRSQRRCSEKTESVRQLQAQVCTRSRSCPSNVPWLLIPDFDH